MKPGTMATMRRHWPAGLVSAFFLLLSHAGDSRALEEKHHLTLRPPISTGALGRDERQIVSAFEKVDPAVVVLITKETAITEEDEELRLRPSAGTGSGVVISEEGDVLTAAHVVSGAQNLRARLPDGSTVEASILFSHAASDVAVVRLAAGHSPIPPAVLGDSDRVQVGQTALVIGAPLGAEHSLSVGHISARRKGDEFLGGAVAAEMLQTDAAVNLGNSGGPLVNLRGEVIGIISRILTTSGGSQGLGFAVSSNTIKQLLGEEPVPWIGVNALFIGRVLTRALHIPSEGALLVQSVAEGSPAERAGIRGGDLAAHLGSTRLVLGGDVILAIEDQPACHRECIAHEIRSQAQATRLTLTLWRDGHEVQMEIPVEQPRILRRPGRGAAPGEFDE